MFNPLWFDEFISKQVKYWYGSSYNLAVSAQWETLLALLLKDSVYRDTSKMQLLTIDDMTEADVAQRYSLGAYRYRHNAEVLREWIALRNDDLPFTDAHRFPILMVDSIGPNAPLIGYCRCIRDVTYPIMWPLQYHVDVARQGLGDDAGFESKKDLVVFRGALSGIIDEKIIIHGTQKACRLPIVDKWIGKRWADLGIATLPVQKKLTDDQFAMYLRCKKDGMSTANMMKCKYVLCIEGEDIASGFGWVLASHCVPICPYPFCYEVWFFNGLKPWVHFVPIRADGSDLEDVYEWCSEHVEDCVKIAEAGRKHMQAMLDPVIMKRVKQGVVDLWELKCL
jgi:hypothetical protein